MKTCAAILLLTLSACSLAPDYQKPQPPAPAWRDAASTDILPDADWWNQFGNAELQNILAESLAANNDIRASLQRVQQARAAARITASSLFPSIDATASANRNYTDLINGDTSKSSTARAGLQASYELDLFARNRSDTASALLSSNAAYYDKEALALIVQSGTAQAFIATLALNDRLQVAKDNLENTRDVLNIIQSRFDVGTLSALELAQQKTAYANAQSAMAALEQQREIQRNQLAVLLGKPPQDFNIQTTSLADMKLPAIAPVQPATLITRRPDIQSAEAQLHAANYDIGAARAAFFPNISLSANTVLAANPSTTPTALTAALLQPIFRGGALQGALDISKSRKLELEELYTKAVLTAFQDVQNALAAQAAAATRVTQYTEAATQAKKAYSLARQRFDVGTIDFLTLLETQRSQLSAQDALITARQEQLFASIDLFTAIGGATKTQPTP